MAKLSDPMTGARRRSRVGDAASCLLPPGYERVADLGRGAASVVHRIRRADAVGPDYALKILDVGALEPDAAVAFRREAALLACVDAQGLPTIHETGELDGRPYLIMELVEGQPLTRHLDDGTMGEPELVSRSIEVATTLAAIHRIGLVHRDVKPDNLVIAADGRTRVLDIGLADWAGAQEGSDRVAGTFAYSAPEQTGMLARPVDGRADLYSLGVVLYECAAGEPPFTSKNLADLMHLHAVAPVPDLRVQRPDLAPQFVAIIETLLAKDPDDRYPDALSLVGDLEALRDGALLAGAALNLTGASGSVDGDLIGRDRELATLVARWERAVQGNGGFAIVTGPAGTGRTRLARELSEEVRRGAAVLVLEAVCDPEGSTPLAVVRAAIDQYLSSLERVAEPGRSEALARVRSAATGLSPLLSGMSARLDAVLGNKVGDEPRKGGGEQLAAAAAQLLAELARLAGGMLMIVHNSEWLDSESRRACQYLADDAASAPLLLLATAAVADDAAVAPIDRRELRGLADTTISLEPLDRSAVAGLIASRIGGAEIPTEVVEHIFARSGGSPSAVVDYVRALLEAGALRPAWGVWTLDPTVLRELRMPTTVLGLALDRVQALDAGVREVLALAAVQGMTFDLDILKASSATDGDGVATAVATGVAARLLEPSRDGRYAFQHREVRTELLDATDPDDAAARHQAVADALASAAGSDPETVHRIARHRIAAGVERDPVRAYEACHLAADWTLRQHAADRATELFGHALRAAEAGDITLKTAFRRSYASTLLIRGDLTGAEAQVNLALEVEPDVVERASLYELAASVANASLDGGRAVRYARTGAAELGRAWPRSMVPLVLSSLLHLIAGLVVGSLQLRPAQGRRAERLRAEARLLTVAWTGATLSMRLELLACLTLRDFWPTRRLGPSPERDAATASLGFLLKAIGIWGPGQRLMDRAAAEAETRDDPRHVATIHWASGLIDAIGRSSCERLESALEKHGRWLSTADYAQAVSVIATVLDARGYVLEGEAWLARGRQRLERAPGTPHGYALAFPQCSVHAFLGRAHAASDALREAWAALGDSQEVREHRIYGAWTELIVSSEQGDLGEAFDRAAANFAAEKLSPKNPPAGFVTQTLAFGRLAQAQAATGDERLRRLDQADEALAALRKAGPREDLRTAHRVGIAWVAYLRGKSKRAWKELERARRMLRVFDSPTLEFESARLWAWLLDGSGQPDAAVRAARSALQVAVDGGWEERARRVREEFGLATVATSVGRSSRATGTAHHAPTDRRRLEALQVVSAAAASVIDPDELIRVALDATLQLLAAERAFLFLSEGDGEKLRPAQGRLAGGQAIDQPTGYGASLVERVHASGEALVVTGSEEGEALGSRSAVVHGLRSILVAPLQLKGRRLGVVYLDSRVAKGIFTDDDVELLIGITNHVAATLETVRASQLEVAVRTAREQRDLADTLRASMTKLNATLDPHDVLRRLLETVSSELPGDRACLLRVADESVVDVELINPGAIASTSQPDLDPHGLALATWLNCSGPRISSDGDDLPDPLRTLLGAPRSWLAFPIVIRDERVGIVVVASSERTPYGDVEVQVAAAFAEQAVAAYDNARLFSQVQSLATTDPLTGQANRRHFCEQAEVQLQRANDLGSPLAAVMLDIDHFKVVNDRHGHAVGDTVLVEVADRLRSRLRGTDVIGRYGGEEFAILLPGDPDPPGLAERLRDVIAAEPIATEVGPVHVTISLGVTAFKEHDDFDTLLARADAALYRSKGDGRNRVTVG